MRLTVSSSASSRTVANITLEEKYGQSVLKKNKIRFYWNLKESHFFHCKDSVWKAGSIPELGVIRGRRLYYAPIVFLPGILVFPSLQNPTLPNSNSICFQWKKVQSVEMPSAFY